MGWINVVTEKRNYGLSVAIAIMILSILQNHVNIVSPAMERINAAFPGYSDKTVAMVLTIASIGAIPATLAAGILTYRFREKDIVLFGFCLLTISGILSMITSNFVFLLVLRFFTGFGAGLVSPFQTSLIPKYFSGNRASLLYGLQCCVVSSFAIIYGFLGGWLASKQWNYCFSLYSLGLLGLLVVLFWLPRGEVPGSTGEKHRLSFKGIYILVLCFTFVYQIGIFSFNSEISYFITSRNLGDSVYAGYCVAMNGLGAVLSGLIYGSLRKKVGLWVVPVGLLSISLGFVVLAQASGIIIAMVGSLMVGFSIGMIMPTVLNLSAAIYKDSNPNWATAVTLCMVSVAQFVNPYFTSFIRLLFGGGSYRETYIVCGILMLILCVLSCIANQKKLFKEYTI